jgi:hypothetical protein
LHVPPVTAEMRVKSEGLIEHPAVEDVDVSVVVVDGMNQHRER